MLEPVRVDADGDVRRLGHHPAVVAHLDPDGVHPYDPWSARQPDWWEVQAAIRALAEANDVVIVDAGQEGMICLHELISREEGLVEDIPRLRRYFKTKFRNRILDYIRKQESQKRRYDKEPYEEVGEISHRISEGGLWLDDYYLFHETLRDYRSKQNKEKREELERVLRNERFRGRQRVLRDLRIVFKEFDLRTR